MNTTRLWRLPSGHAVKLHRRMGQVLHKLHHHRTLAAFHGEKALHPQQVRSAQRNQRVHGFGEGRPRHRPVLRQHETADAVRVRGLRHERIALIAGRLRDPAGIELAVHRFEEFPRPH